MPKSLLDAVIVRARGVRGGNMTRLRIFEWEEKKKIDGGKEKRDERDARRSTPTFCPDLV
jgi:hypothetical protein